MTTALPALAKLKPNPHWARLPLFDRKGWQTVRFGDDTSNKPAKAQIGKI